MKYSQYLELKEMVLNDETTVNFVSEFLNVPLIVARCLVKDWKEQQDRMEDIRKIAGSCFSFEPTRSMQEAVMEILALSSMSERKSRIISIANKAMDRYDEAFKRLAKHDKDEE
jgi:hypothetical protein